MTDGPDKAPTKEKQTMGEVAALFLGVVVTMLLWNQLVPDIFGLPRVNFWQAAGLCLLSALLFRDWGLGKK